MSFTIPHNTQRSMRQLVWLTLACVFVCAQMSAQESRVPPQVFGAPQAASRTPDPSGQLAQIRPNYVLRPGDQILIRAFEMEEIGNQPYRIDGDGFIDLPVLGRIQAAGVSVEKLEANLEEAMKKYVKVPQVTLTVVQFSSEPVFFVGAFKSLRSTSLASHRVGAPWWRMMSASIGGLLPTASRRIKVTRRKEYGPIPRPNARTLADGSGSTLEINMAALQNNLNPEDDIVFAAVDELLVRFLSSVERAQMIYVMGEVGHVGGFDLQEQDSMSVIQVLTMAGGLTATANPKNALILRPIMDTSRRAAIPIDLPRILKGELADKPLLANDVLVIGKGSSISGKNLITFLPLVTTFVNLGFILTR